ncbi:MAG: antibiotic biosynthesis monooxygenase [Candidatus Tectomicrobia bacterium]|uniref:Antibiotic biosynthesis monooxygenase n=1 Tax=Tectimicrobiota bacterium TaxID=2528274 RepID=A0A932M2A0_UNCTE|nr:antibiotic biosynthesis monooxygenase [Candidatus Tectomicrobia bacterium]
MFIALTRYEGNPDQPIDEQRLNAIQEAAAEIEGWLGSMVFRSTTDPKKMMRITMWESLEVRDRFHASESGRRLGLGEGPQREYYELVRETRPRKK